MFAPLTVAFSSIGISLIFNLKNWRRVSLCFSFFPIFLFIAFRFDYGNDYFSYLYMFREIASAGSISYDPEEWHAEIGWFYLNRIFSDAGFFSMIFFLAIFNCCVYFRFIQKFVPCRYYWCALFLYIIVPDNMLVQLSAMRQAVAISFFLISIEFIVKKDLLKYALCIFMATLFHSSALILFPIYFLGQFNFTIKKYIIYIFLGIYVGLFFFSNHLSDVVFAVGGGLAENYSIYRDAGSIGSGFGLVFYGFYLVMMLAFYNRQASDVKVLFALGVVGIYLIPFAVSVGLVARIGYYFGVVGIAVVPLIAVQLKNKIIRSSYILLNVVYALYGCYQFFQNPIYRIKYSDFKSIFSISAGMYF